MFRLLLSHPQTLKIQIQTYKCFIASWNPQSLQNKKCTLYVYKTSLHRVYRYVEQES